MEQPQPEFAFYFIFPFFTTVALADKHAEKGQLMRNAKTPETANDGGETTGRCAAGCFLKRKLDPEGYFFPPSQRVISVYFSDIVYQQTESRARGVREFYRRRRRKKKRRELPSDNVRMVATKVNNVWERQQHKTQEGFAFWGFRDTTN